MSAVSRARARSALAVGLVSAAFAVSGCTGSAAESSTAQPSPAGAAQTLDPSVRHVQPGAPGEPNTVLTEAPPQPELRSPFNEVDIAFLEDMKVHHQQAVDVVALVPDRAQRDDLVSFARRMEISQEGELGQIDRLLEEHAAVSAQVAGADGLDGAHDEHGDGGHDEHADQGHAEDAHADEAHAEEAHDHADMPGMLTDAELAALEQAEGEQFVRLFLDGMTRHHEGALLMVAELLADETAASDPRLFEFANDVDSDQRIELNRMARLRDALGS